MELIYGKKPILEILTHRPELICKLYVSGKTTELEAIPALNDIPSEQVTATELDQLTKGGVHQGIVAELVGRNEGSISSLIEQSSSSGSGVIIVLDEVVDPHNLGAIYRVADAAGVDGVVVTTKRSSPVTAVVRKVSMGATELVPTVFATNLQRTLRELKKSGFWIVGTVAGGDARSVYDVELPSPTVVVFGSEGKGIRRLTEKECDLCITIPMSGYMSSLNVSHSVAVVGFELLRRRS